MRGQCGNIRPSASEGLHLLGSICSHAVLSDGRSQFAARDLRRFSDCNEQAVCIWVLRQAPTRSTLAYANAHRLWQLYQTVFEELLRSCQNLAATKKRRFRFKHPLRSVDTSIIELCIKVFDWARFQRTKGAISPRSKSQLCLPSEFSR